jgi:hypothetical protein
LDGETLVLEVGPDFLGFAGEHLEEYRELAKKAAGRTLRVQIRAGSAAAPTTAAEPSTDDLKRDRLRKEAEREPAVQEALNLFGGKVVEVREAKPAKESA